MRERRSIWLSALLLPLPLVAYNPDFARTLGQWAELFAPSIVTLVAFATAASWMGRLFGGSPEQAGVVGAWAWLLVALTLVGWVVGGSALGVGSAAAAVLAAALAFARRGLQGRSFLAATAIAVVVQSTVGYVATHRQAPEHQVVMIGLDGTTWKLIDQFRSKEQLPNFDRLIRNGASAELDTLDPILSPPIWTSIASGMRPDRHGVRDFWASSLNVKVKRLWDITDEAGLLTGVYGYLTTWPVTPISGFLVPGWTAQGNETWPPELSFVKRLERSEKAGEARGTIESIGIGLSALRYGITLETLNEVVASVWRRRTEARDEERIAAENRQIKLSFNTDVYCHLLRSLQPDFSIFYDSALDATQHLFFKYFEPAGFPSLTREQIAVLGEAIPTIYRRADKTLGRILANAHANANVVIVSDHGQEVDQKGEGSWYSIRSGKFLEELGLSDTLRATNIGAYVYLRAADPDAPDPAKLEAAWKAIRELVTPSGKPLVDLRVKTPTEARILTSDDFDLEKTPELEFRGRRIEAASLLEKSGTISGIHTDTAFFLMHGPEIRSGSRLQRGSILDVAPTVLALLRLPVARDMEGKVLESGFRPDFVSENPVAWVDTHGAPKNVADGSAKELDGKLVDSLKTLGYVQ
jgi:predicted AlkP superfamily phosphohydrolase/phosphomutase